MYSPTNDVTLHVSSIAYAFVTCVVECTFNIRETSISQFPINEFCDFGIDCDYCILVITTSSLCCKLSKWILFYFPPLPLELHWYPWLIMECAFLLVTSLLRSGILLLYTLDCTLCILALLIINFDQSIDKTSSRETIWIANSLNYSSKMNYWSKMFSFRWISLNLSKCIYYSDHRSIFLLHNMSV